MILPIPRPIIMDFITPPAAPAVAVSGSAKPPENSGGLFLIAVFELVKTVLFLVAAAGVYHLVRRDTQVELIKLLHIFRINGDWQVVKPLVLKANLIDPYKVRISIILVVYAVLHATEGMGLLLRKRWAEYFTVIMTAIPLPYEVFLLVHHTTHSKLDSLVPHEQWHALHFTNWVYLKIAALLGNAAIVGYLVYHLRRGGKHGRLVQAEPLLPAQGAAEQSGQPG